MDIFLQLTVSGLSTGMIYALAAAGFVVIYKASDVINFAQGDLLLLGTYLIFFAVAQTGLPWSLGVLVTVLLAVAVALAIERLVLRPLVGEPVISMIMVTIGLSSVLRGAINAIWGPNPRAFESFLPAGDLVIGPAVLSAARVLSIPIALAVLAALGLFFRYTRDGIAMRAIADDQQAALSMGISIPRVFGVAWGLAAASAAIGGIMLGNIVGVSPNVAAIGLRVFPVVILGGLDSIKGAVVGGAIIGLLEVYVGFYVGHGLNLVVPYLVLILVLMVRPYGLFGRRSSSAYETFSMSMECGVFHTRYESDMGLRPRPAQRIRLGVLALFVLAFPFVASTYWLDLANQVAIATVGAIGLNILVGYTGQISLARAPSWRSGPTPPDS